MLDTQGAQYLYFTRPDAHRFTQVHSVSQGHIEVSRLISSYYVANEQVETWAQYPHDHLYISILYAPYDQNYQRTLSQAECVEVEFSRVSRDDPYLEVHLRIVDGLSTLRERSFL